MQTNIKFRITFNKRFLSFLLAFTVAFVGLPFVGFDMGVKADTLSGDGKRIYSTKADTSTKVSNTITTGDTDFSYTGTYQTAPVTLFDYVSDEEIIGTYNSITDSRVWDYTDPFTYLNSAISNSGTKTHSSDENITINYKADKLYFSNSPSVFVHIWCKDDSSYTTEWPGKRMIYDRVNQQYTYTFNPTDLGFNDSHKPDKVIFNDNHGHQVEFDQNVMTAGNTYSYGQEVKIKCIVKNEHKNGDVYIYLWNKDNTDIKNATWPGEKMTKVEGTDNVFEYSFDSSVVQYHRFKINGGLGQWETPSGSDSYKQPHSSGNSMHNDVIYMMSLATLSLNRSRMLRLVLILDRRMFMTVFIHFLCISAAF